MVGAVAVTEVQWDILAQKPCVTNLHDMNEAIGYTGAQRVILESKLRNIFRLVLTTSAERIEEQLMCQFDMSLAQYWALLERHTFAAEILKQESEAMQAMGTLGAAELAAVRYMPEAVERMAEVIRSGTNAESINAVKLIATIAGVDRKQAATATATNTTTIKIEFAQPRPGFPVTNGAITIDG